MPVVFRYKGCCFFFYSNEGSPLEPVHIHARGEGGEVKFWLHPAVRVAASDGLDARTLRGIEQVDQVLYVSVSTEIVTLEV